MKFKNALLVTFAIFSLAIVNAQDVKLKKGKIILDKNEILKFEKSTMALSLFDLNKDEEIIFIKWNNNETINYLEDDYIIINFLELDLVCEISISYSRKAMVKKLVKEKVISQDGQIDEEKAKIFLKKYDENITNRTIRN